MVKRDPDDLISALSKNLKGQNSPILRFTFKRGGLWQSQFAKAHSRVAKKQIKQKLKIENAQEERQWPLLVRYKENQKQEVIRLNANTKIGQSQNFIDSMLSVFRVNFFKKKQEKKQKIIKGISKPNPESKTTARKLQKKLKNKERKQKYKELKKSKKKEAQKTKQILKK